MGKFLMKKITYKSELSKSMKWLSNQKDTLFIGQAVEFSGHAMSSTLNDVSSKKKIELPVFEETQMGIAMGLGISGFVPINIYPRFDFFILSLNQFINHLDKVTEMTSNKLCSKVITRVSVGTKIPFSAGPQHTQDYSKAIIEMVKRINVVELNNPKIIFNEYKKAYERKDQKSTLMIEYGDLYAD